jgi:hypothetical protein
MCVKVIGMKQQYVRFAIFLLVGFGLHANPPTAHALDLEPYKKTCSEIGFKQGTEKHGQCVLKLYSRANKSEEMEKKTATDREQQARIERQQREIIARQQRIEELNRQRVIAAQKAAEEAETQRRVDSVGKIFKGLSMMSGGQPTSSYGSGGRSGGSFLSRSYVSGMNRICTYSGAGGDRTKTIGAAEICPLSY